MNDLLVSLKSTLAQLVAIDSTSARSNEPMIEYLQERLRPLGFALKRQTYLDDAGVRKTNLIATIAGDASQPVELALVGHTDCVPYDSAWKEALLLEERDGRLYGRGACDTKAFIAAAITAAGRVEPLKPLALVFTADEELGCVGAKQLVDAKAVRARYAIVGEPTSLAPVRANKGYCLAEIEIEGKEGHSAYPDTGASAIYRAARFIRRIEELSAELRSETDASFEPPFTTVNVGTISGGKAKNIIPGRCRFHVEWRPIPGQSPKHVFSRLEDIGKELKSEDAGFSARIDLLRQDNGAQSAPDSPIVRFIADQSGKEPTTVPFGTEAGHLAALGAETVVFGPGNIQFAHRTGEFVPIDELVRAEAILERAIIAFCSGRQRLKVEQG